MSDIPLSVILTVVFLGFLLFGFGYIIGVTSAIDEEVDHDR